MERKRSLSLTSGTVALRGAPAQTLHGQVPVKSASDTGPTGQPHSISQVLQCYGLDPSVSASLTDVPPSMASWDAPWIMNLFDTGAPSDNREPRSSGFISEEDSSDIYNLDYTGIPINRSNQKLGRVQLPSDSALMQSYTASSSSQFSSGGSRWQGPTFSVPDFAGSISNQLAVQQDQQGTGSLTTANNFFLEADPFDNFSSIFDLHQNAGTSESQPSSDPSAFHWTPTAHSEGDQELAFRFPKSVNTEGLGPLPPGDPLLDLSLDQLFAEPPPPLKQPTQLPSQMLNRGQPALSTTAQVGQDQSSPETNDSIDASWLLSIWPINSTEDLEVSDSWFGGVNPIEQEYALQSESLAQLNNDIFPTQDSTATPSDSVEDAPGRVRKENRESARSSTSSHDPDGSQIKLVPDPTAKSVTQINPLIIIQESGTTEGTIYHKRKRGVRSGKLEKEKAVAIATKRKTHEVCIRCRISRSECTGGLPCQRCRDSSGKTVGAHPPCLKAHFVDIIESGSCNYVSQRAINHLTLDGKRRIAAVMPEKFSLSELLTMVQERQSSFNIRRRSTTGVLFEINMANYAKFLKSIKDRTTNPTDSFRDFINLALVEAPSWTTCVTSSDSFNNMLTRLGVWNNEPCRASYDMVPTDSSEPRPLDVENPDDLQEIVLAAMLSRIICRKLEIDGYRALQNSINKLRFETADRTILFLKQTGQVLLTLRWRLAWWDVYGDGRGETDPFRLQYVERVKSLTLVLYFYYFTVKRRVSSWSNTEGLDGRWNNYADIIPIWDEFPTEESVDGLEKWLARGRDIVKDAKEKLRLPHLKGT